MTAAVSSQESLFDPLELGGVMLDITLVPTVGLHPAVAAWFRQRFPDGPTPAQEAAWPAIAAGEHTLLAAPTGSGKTLAGFLMAINGLYVAHARGEPVTGTRVVYVSPLKALAVDIAENLERPLAQIAATARAMGLSAPELTVGVRTGDTTASERAGMIRSPRTFVVTTPESLYLLVTSARSRATLRGVETVIVDEIHALARDKRGSHLTLTLERLAHVCAGDPARVGLSATQKPIERVAALLVGTRTGADGEPACRIVDTGHGRALDVALELPDGELEAIASAAQMASVLDRIAELVAEHRTTIVFVNTRRLAERLAHELGERLGDDVVAAHHGSLSKDRRMRVERRLRAGELKALVATASLELGIDIGPVELVCQIGSPRSIATFLQRVGRSNHTRSGTPRGRLYPLTRDELVECAGLLAAVRAGRLDAVEVPEAPLDILAQQVIAETAAEEWTADRLYALVTRAHAYRSLTRERFDEVLDLVSNGIETGRGTRAAYVHFDRVNGELRGRKGARLAALTSGGAIPELGDFRVIADPEETLIGTVNEDWATESMAGDVFILGTHHWQIRQVTGGEVRVVDAGDKHPTIPFWRGEAPARTVELSEEVTRIRSVVERGIQRDDLAGAVDEIVERAGVERDAAATIVTYLAAGRAVLGVMPTQTDLVIERFFDESGGMQLVVHSPYGGRLNRALGYALRKKFCAGFNFELQASANDDAIVISLGPHHSFPLADVPRLLSSRTIRATLQQAVLDQPVFQSRWRWNLNRGLIVLRMRGGKRVPPNFQRMQSDDLLAAVFPGAAACQENVTGPIEVPDHPLPRQAVHDCLTEALDCDGLIALWEQVEAGEVRFHFVDSTEPSLLAHEILTAKPYAFLDDGEAVDRRTNAVPLRRGLPTTITEMGRVTQEAVDRVRAEIEPAPTTPDELHDLLAMLLLSPCPPEWAELVTVLQAKGRVVSLVGDDGVVRWHTVEAAGAVRALVEGVDVDGTTAEDAAAQVLRGHLEVASPLIASDLGRRTGLSATRVAVGLATLEAQGFALQGRFSERSVDAGDDPATVEWSSRRLLARMHSYSRAQRRRRYEPVSPEQLMRFVVQWHHVTGATQHRGIDGVARVIGQLQGYETAAGAWEPQVLARRVRDYDPAWLDRLCHQGEVTWLRLCPPSREDPDRRLAGATRTTPVSLVLRADLPWLLAAHRGEVAPPVPACGAVAEIVEVLAGRGACFASELATATGRVLADIEAALWEGMARGLLASDGFEPVRAVANGRRQAPAATTRRSPIRTGHGLRVTETAGRWSLVPPPATDVDREELAEALADQLLERWGVVFYDLVAAEHPALRWRDLQWALRRMEDRGLVAGGRFVRGFAGEQFALPQAAEALQAIRRAEPSGRTIRLPGTDPLNLTGVVLPGPRTPARTTETFDLPI
ncbi:MAG TPA: DEAD/DEAH box helicase [Acidimicrobiales bacterium]|nr:DEAD/DEAH box helicase [Acidimicrobiales bacterium]